MLLQFIKFLQLETGITSQLHTKDGKLKRRSFTLLLQAFYQRCTKPLIFDINDRTPDKRKLHNFKLEQEGHDGPGSLTESFSPQMDSTSLFFWFQLVTQGVGPVLIPRGII